MQATCLCYKMASIEKMQFSSQWHFNEEDEWIRVRELHHYGLARVNINYAYSSRGKNIYFTFNGRGCEEIVFEHLKQLAKPNVDSDSQKSVFYRVETL